MILQRCIALSKTFHLLRQNITPAKSTVILNQRFSFSDDNNNNNSLTTQHEIPSRSEDEERQLKLIQLELSFLRDNGHRVPNPENINKYQWDELLQIKTKAARNKYYTFLFSIEKRKENLLMKRQARKQSLEEFKERRALEVSPENSHVVNSWSNKFMLRIRSSTMNKWYNNKLIRAMQFGEKLVFDLSYDPHMSRRESANAAKQLMFCFAENRRHREPLDLHFCNAIPTSNTMKYLEKHIPTVRNKEFPLNLHEGSYLDIFPKEKLVYLTPHCNVDLVEYDPDTIYIIGAMVDKTNQQPLSLGKAKELGLRMARLPLDKYLKWGEGSGKSLTLDQMTKIMLDIKTTSDWSYALRHVPSRKINSDKPPPMKIVRKWTTTLDKPKFNSYPKRDDNTMSTADKFRQKIKWTKVN